MGYACYFSGNVVLCQSPFWAVSRHFTAHCHFLLRVRIFLWLPHHRFQFGKFLQDQAVGRIVCRRLVGMVVTRNALLVNDEDAGHLETAADRFTHAVFEKAGKRFAHYARASKQTDVAIGQAVSLVGTLLWIAQAREWQPIGVPEIRCLLRIAHCHHDDFRAESLKLLIALSQLRHMRTAEWSAEVA